MTKRSSLPEIRLALSMGITLVACSSSGGHHDGNVGGAGNTGGVTNTAGAGGTGSGAGPEASVGGAPCTTVDSGVPVPGSQNWTMFGHDYANSRTSNDRTISAANIPCLHVTQRVAAAGVTSTPAIVDGVAYYGDFSGHVKAVDATTGDVVWDTLAQQPSDVGGYLAMISGSPFVSSDTVYVGGNNGWVYALDRAQGGVKWRTQIEATKYSRVSSSPVVVENTLIIGSGSYQVFVPVASAPDMFRGSVKGLNASTGKVMWSAQVCNSPDCGSGVSVWSSAAVDEASRLAFIGTGQTYTTPAGALADSLVAVDYTTGEVAWSQQYTTDDVYNINTPATDPHGLDHDVGASPNLFTATIDGVSRELVGAGDKGGHYKAFDRKTGAPVWSADLGYGSPIGGVMHSTAYSDGFIYVVNNTGVDGGTRSDARPRTSLVYKLDAATGNWAWRTPLTGGGFGGISIANGLMYFTTWDGQLRVIDTMNGKLLRSIPVSTAIGAFIGTPTTGFPDGSASGPVVSNHHIYVGFGWTWISSITGGLAILQ